jgi:hypothetical protein
MPASVSALIKSNKLSAVFIHDKLATIKDLTPDIKLEPALFKFLSSVMIAVGNPYACGEQCKKQDLTPLIEADQK